MAEVQQEVSGSVDSLSHMIDDGQIEKPNLMAFNAWQQWRSRAGRRPTVQRDGVRITQRDEANLWRQTMAANYGDDWQIELEAGNADDDVAAGDEDDEDLRVQAEPAEVPLQVSPAGEVLHPGATARAATARTASPGSGIGTATPGILETPRRQVTQEGLASPGGSWKSADPGTPSTITGIVGRMYDPTVESLDVYQNRLQRQVRALESIGSPMDAARVDLLLIKASILSVAPAESKLKYLKQEYAVCLLEEETPEICLRVLALEQMLADT